MATVLLLGGPLPTSWSSPDWSNENPKVLKAGEDPRAAGYSSWRGLGMSSATCALSDGEEQDMSQTWEEASGLCLTWSEA